LVVCKVKYSKLIIIQKRALAQVAANKRLLTSVNAAKAMRVSLDKSHAARQLKRENILQARRNKLKQGLTGYRIGKHKVADSQIDVQIGEELSESLRGLKVRMFTLIDGLGSSSILARG
jgi:nucleolar protein 53